ncbi:MAG: hypothetical protein K9N49_01035 [Candidatus Marinimicrobia bacterium]|nr:hypothetical protein [Candidatus Neomarinimicrobiota bacterium]
MRTLWLMLCWVAASCSAGWYFEAGPWWRGDIDIAVEGGSRAALEGVRAARSGTVGGMAEPIGPLLDDDGTEQRERRFDDGFVGLSGWDWAREEGYTQYWGYDRQSAYDPATSTLSFERSFRAETSATRQTTSVRSRAYDWGGRHRTSADGLLMTLGYAFVTRPRWEIAAQLQAGRLEGIDARFDRQRVFTQEVTTRTYRSTRSREESVTYSYDTLGNPFFPDAPYEMTEPDGIGPFIRDTPTVTESRQRVTQTDELINTARRRAESHVDFRLNTTANVLALGPRLRLRPIPRLALIIQPTVTLYALETDIVRHETFGWRNGHEIKAWQERHTDRAERWGASVSGGLQLEVTANLTLSVLGGYDWIEEYSFAAGLETVTLDLEGYRAEAAIGLRFGP